MVLVFWLTSSDFISFRAEQGQLKPSGRRAVKEHKEHCNAAKFLDSKHHRALGDKNGRSNPFFCRSGLWPVAGKYEGKALGLSTSCLEELSAGCNGVCTFIALSRAVSYVGRYKDKSPKEALGVFRSGARRVWGHVAVFRLERPHLGPEPQARWHAAARRLRQAFGWRLKSSQGPPLQMTRSRVTLRKEIVQFFELAFVASLKCQICAALAKAQPPQPPFD